MMWLLAIVFGFLSMLSSALYAAFVEAEQKGGAPFAVFSGIFMGLAFYCVRVA